MPLGKTLERLETDMSAAFYSVVYIVLFILALASIAAGLYTGAKSLGGIKAERKMLASFIAPLVLVVPGMRTEEGKKYRRRFFVFLLIAGVAVLGLNLMESAYGKPPYME